jgi:glutathione S-transferase
MRLYEDPRTPSSRRVNIFLAEKGIKVPSVMLDINAREHLSAAHLARNPLGQVPVLQLDDGTFIAESMAICRYFECLRPDPPLLGRPGDARDQALVEMWNRRVELGLLLPVFHVFRHTHPAMKTLENPQIPQWARANRPRIERMLDLLDQRLAHAAHVAGENLSVADITAFVAMDFMRVLRLSPDGERAHLKRWLKHMRARPAVIVAAAKARAMNERKE